MKRVERFIGLACALMVAVSLGVGGVKAARNPMDARLADFELELAAVIYVPEKYVTDSDVDYGVIVWNTAVKATLWKELVPPPPPPVRKPRPVKHPDLRKLLQGVVVSSRLEITGVGGRTLIDVKTPEDLNGSWLGIGDKVRGLTIKEITKEAVVFSLMSNNKEYTYSLRRR